MEGEDSASWRRSDDGFADAAPPADETTDSRAGLVVDSLRTFFSSSNSFAGDPSSAMSALRSEIGVMGIPLPIGEKECHEIKRSDRRSERKYKGKERSWNK